MQYQILKEPMAMLEIQLKNEEQLTAEAGGVGTINKTKPTIMNMISIFLKLAYARIKHFSFNEDAKSGTITELRLRALRSGPKLQFYSTFAFVIKRKCFI
jgi:hypothetical protein